MSNLDTYAKLIFHGVSEQLTEDLKTTGKASSNTEQLGIISGLLNLHIDTSEELETYYEMKFLNMAHIKDGSETEEQLKVIRLMLKDELEYVDRILKG